MKTKLMEFLQDLKERLAKLNRLKFKSFSKLGLSRKKILIYMILGLMGIYFVFMLFTKSPKPASYQSEEPEQQWTKTEEFKGDGVAELTDPRAIWVAKIERQFGEEIEKLKTNHKQEQQETTDLLAKYKSELEEFRNKLDQEKETRELQGASNGDVLPVNTVLERAVIRPPKTLGHISRTYKLPTKDTIDYLPSGSSARAVVMMGVVVGTGTKSASAPEPIMLRLTDSGIFSKGNRIIQIKEAILLGECTGDLASERAKCRINSISFKNRKGEIVENKINAWVVGEDGAYGVQGLVVDRSSDQIRMAALNGLLGGMASFFQNQASKSIYPISPISGQQNALSATNSLKSGIASGTSNALEKIADYGIARAEQMSPVIIVSAEREVDIVFAGGVQLNNLLEEASATNSLQTVVGNNPNNNTHQDVTPNFQMDPKKQANAFADVLEEVNKQELPTF